MFRQRYDDYAAWAKQVEAELLEKVRGTEMGRGLLKYLEDQKIECIVTTAMPSFGDEEVELGGLYDGLNRKMYLNAQHPIPALMHFLAHETRHVAQLESDRELPTTSALLDPVNHLYATRLREMDADTFAIAFVFNHTIETKEPVFQQLFENGKGWANYGFFSSGELRGKLYDAFYETYEQSGFKDVIGSLRHVYSKMIYIDTLKEGYDQLATLGWRSGIWKNILENAEKPESDFSRSFAAVARKKPQDAKELFKQRAARYSALFGDIGAIDYLKDLDMELVFEHVAKAEDAQIHGKAREMLVSANDDFKRAVAHYAKMPSGMKKTAAKSRKPRQGRSRAV